MPRAGVEPARWGYHHEILSLARLPIPSPRLILAARPGFEPGLETSKASGLPLADLAINFERRTGLEPVTFSLATRYSTTELPPLDTAISLCARARNCTGISCFSDTRRDCLGYPGPNKSSTFSNKAILTKKIHLHNH